MNKRKRLARNSVSKSNPISSIKAPSKPLPPDVIFDIFTRLPLKSLMRFKILAKFCFAMITNSLFNLMHRPLHQPKPGILITCPIQLQSGQAFYTAGPRGGRATHHLTIPPRFSRYTTQAVNGIVCMDFGLCATICNPSTRQAITLPFVTPTGSPAAASTFFCVNTFGFDRVTNHYKVLNSWGRYQEGKTEYRVFMLGTSSWRPLPSGPHCYPHRESVYVDGIIFFRAWVMPGMHHAPAILVSFDVHNETFRVIGLPRGAPENVECSCLINLKGRLGVVDYQLDNHNRIILHILKNFPNDGWITENIVFSPQWRKMGRDQRYFVVGTTSNGEIIVAPRCLSKPFVVFFYNRETSSRSKWRSAKICGLPEYDSFDVSRNVVTITNYEENIFPLL